MNHQPQFTFIQAETGREFGDFWCPAADQEAIGEKNQRYGRAFPGHQGSDGDGVVGHAYLAFNRFKCA
jgi:hypothetical protein